MSTIIINEIHTGSNCSVMNYKLTKEKECYECRGLFVLEDDEQYSAHCLNLPGVHSQGDSLERAIYNLNEAFEGTIRSYARRNVDIPWSDISDRYREEAGEERRTAVYV